MSRWFFEWLMLSAVLIIGVGTGLSLWTVWPLVDLRINGAGNVEGLLAMTMLVIVGLGFFKLVFAPTPPANQQ